MSVRDLQRALEIAHYAARQRGSIFVAGLVDVPVHEVLLDIKLVAAYGLPGIFVARPEDGPAVRRARAEGAPVAALAAGAVGSIPETLSAGRVPVLLDHRPGPSAQHIARTLQARRLLLIERAPAALIDGPRGGHVTRIEAARRAGADTPAGRQWAEVCAVLANGVSGVVLLPARTGCLFEELFTHHGAGVLVGDALQEGVRPATIGDAAELSLLLRAEMDRGVVRPVDERDIATTAHQHLVYAIDEVVVGTARLAPYGAWAELSRFATLPRYRGRGRARVLGEALIERAAAEGYTDLFALSVDARMWRFFQSLGFTAIDRGDLPEAWQAQYDFSRPSRAFHRRPS